MKPYPRGNAIKINKKIDNGGRREIHRGFRLPAVLQRCSRLYVIKRFADIETLQEILMNLR